ncbi:MAG: short-chain dehydrogenase, partial [Verrucomicrobiota bacterium]
MFNLKNKNALVTGSSRGMGAAIAIALAEAAGVGQHEVHLLRRDPGAFAVADARVGLEGGGEA